MDNLIKLRKDLDARLRETELVKSALSEQDGPEARTELNPRYLNYLSRVAAQYAPHSPIVMALAASRCMTTHPEMARYLLHHVGEEQGHEFYEHMGFRTYAPRFVDASYGPKVPLLMLFGDRDRFRFVGSPLRRIADRYADDAEARVWFEKRYPSLLSAPVP